jgi:hypothetical protein
MPRNYLCFPSKQVDHLVRLDIFIFAALDLGLFGYPHGIRFLGACSYL